MSERAGMTTLKLDIDPQTSMKWDIEVDFKAYKDFLRKQGLTDEAIEKLSISFLYEEDTKKKNYGFYKNFEKNISLYFKDLEDDNSGAVLFDDIVNEGFLHETAHFIEDMSGKGDNITRKLMRTATGFLGAAYTSAGLVGAGVLHYGYSKYRSGSPETGRMMIKSGLGVAALTALSWRVRTSRFYHDYIDPAEQFAFGFADKYQDNRFIRLRERTTKTE